MKKKIKRLIAMALFISIFTQTTMFSSALTPLTELDNLELITTIDIVASDLQDMKNALENDPSVTSVNLDNNRLTIVQSNGSVSVIEKTVSNGIHNYKITENNKIDIICINPVLDQITLNNEPVQLSVSLSNENVLLPAATNIYYGSSSPNIVAEQAIAMMTTAGLYTLLFTVLNGIGIVMSLVSTIITAYQMYDSASNKIYVTRYIYRNSDYTEFKYVDDYYREKYEEGYITTKISYAY